jgi:dienelactone hydrolase
MRANEDVRFRLTRAFAVLRSRGYVARQHYMCCSSCAGAALAGQLQERVPEGFRGAVFYHAQDAEALAHKATTRDPLSLCVRFGPVIVDDVEYGLSKAQVGREVEEVLCAEGLTVSWDGDPETTIEVTGVNCAFVAAEQAARAKAATLATLAREKTLLEAQLARVSTALVEASS